MNYRCSLTIRLQKLQQQQRKRRRDILDGLIELARTSTSLSIMMMGVWLAVVLFLTNNGRQSSLMADTWTGQISGMYLYGISTSVSMGVVVRGWVFMGVLAAVWVMAACRRMIPSRQFNREALCWCWLACCCNDSYSFDDECISILQYNLCNALNRLLFPCVSRLPRSPRARVYSST